MNSADSSVVGPIRRWFKSQRERRAIRRWRREGRPGPAPHAIKQQTIREHASRYGCRVLVETGTFLGDMVEAMRPHFDRVYTIELSEGLYSKACERFAGCAGVELIQGDSGAELAKLAPQIEEPALFWLDGHWSAGATAKGEKETPIQEELDCLIPLLNRGHVLLIDDARLFGTDPSYPTVEEIRARFDGASPPVEVSVDSDIIRVHAAHTARAAA